MKKLFLMVAMVVISLMAMAQTNQLVWANGQLLYATPTDKVDSLTYDASFEGDTLFFIMPHKLVQTVHDTVFVHDTVYEQEIVYVHDTVYVECPETPENPDVPIETHEYVDLGLSVKWATCNVGANSPEEYGDYFAWGEVEPKTTYNWDTYKYYDGSNLTKYTGNDSRTVLDPEDDAATANWGGAWRMPTYEEQKELRNNCTWTWTTQNGVNGYKVTGPNGNSIFLPAAGYMGEGSLYGAGSYGHYWSGSLYTDGPYSAYDVGFHSDYVDWYNNGRYYGQSVRPVCQ